MIAQLGLELLKEVEATTAAGIRSVRIFQDAKISLCGREGTFECLELPDRWSRSALGGDSVRNVRIRTRFEASDTAGLAGGVGGYLSDNFVVWPNVE
jgi:hypothetical protein